MLATTPYPYFTKTARRLRTHRHDYSLNVTFFFLFCERNGWKARAALPQMLCKTIFDKGSSFIGNFPTNVCLLVEPCERKGL